MLNFLTTTTVCGFSLYHVLAFFLIYSCTGWCLEVIFAAATTGQLVNRGFLNGPVCPIYGFGVVIVVLCLTPLMENTLLLFLGSVLLTSLLELGVGFALEKLFHQRWWDYTNEPFNLGGYICLRFSLAWGLACLLVMEIIHPSVLWLILHIPHTLGLVLLACFVSVMAVDLTATVRTIARINRSIKRIKSAEMAEFQLKGPYVSCLYYLSPMIWAKIWLTGCWTQPRKVRTGRSPWPTGVRT